MDLKEFQQLALRTESHIDNVEANNELLFSVIEAFVLLTEIMDGLKKSIFYNKDTKLESFSSDETLSKLNTLLNNITTIIRSGEHVNGKQDININPRFLHGIIGIATESGELCSPLLSARSHIDAVNIQEEMSDIDWYKAILNDLLDLDWSEGLSRVIEKLKVRYPDKYSDQYAENRDLEAERKKLEGE